MEKIKYGNEPLDAGMYEHATAYDSIKKDIEFYKLTEEEAEETCFFGYGVCECSTCTLSEGFCKRYFYANENGEIEF